MAKRPNATQEMTDASTINNASTMTLHGQEAQEMTDATKQNNQPNVVMDQRRLNTAYMTLSQPLASGGSTPLMSGRIAAALMSLSFMRLCRLQLPMQRSACVESAERQL